MNNPITKELEIWQDDGGADPEGLILITGSPAQMEWAARIRQRVSAEFIRVAASLAAEARHDHHDQQLDSDDIARIIEEKRVQTLVHWEAAYFIHEWQQITSQVQELIMADHNYEAIVIRRRLRQHG